jgi:hypothetical protein
MMTNDSIGDGESFIIPARTLRGSKREMVEDIDQAIVGLLALRHLIGSEATPLPARPPRGGERTALRRAWEWMLLLTGKVQASFFAALLAYLAGCDRLK